MKDYMDELVKTIGSTTSYLTELEKIEASLLSLRRQGPLSDADENYLAEVETEMLSAHALLEMLENRLEELAPSKPKSKSFGIADLAWTQSVTGVDTHTAHPWRLSNLLDRAVHPRKHFYRAFREIGSAFHLSNEAGRRLFLNLFLSDIVLRPEFGDNLRIFPELDLAVTNGRQSLKGRVDYTVGYAKGLDLFETNIPRQLHVVAVEAKTDFGTHDLNQCIAETAALYKARRDAGKRIKAVWGILSNAQIWQFIHINDNGCLYKSELLTLTMDTFQESEVLRVYRAVYYIIMCCYQACTPPPSVAPSIDYLQQ